VLCQVTSNAYGDRRAIALDTPDFAAGSLHRASFVRPGKLFTAHSTLIAGEVGSLNDAKFAEVRSAVVLLIQTG
jgi:mRNA interferase MazF